MEPEAKLVLTAVVEAEALCDGIGSEAEDAKVVLGCYC